jgi:hypothetical protein
MVFIIDLPKLNESGNRPPSKLTSFGLDLCYFLSAQGLDPGLVKSLEKYDFSETDRYAFVHTM